MHDIYMQEAIDLALKAQGKTSPNPIVGCVIVKSKNIIGRGYHKKCGGAHAEVIALKDAGIKARAATMYVTLEPCAHVGRTAPCVDAVIEAGIKEIYIAMKDPNPKVAGKSISKLKRAGINVNIGLLKEKAEALNPGFISVMTRGVPYTVAKVAQTLDGKIATASGHSQWVTSEKTRNFARKKRDQFDAIMIGVGTLLKDNPRLAASKKSIPLKKIVVDTRCQISPRATMLRLTPKDVIVVTTEKSPKIKRQRIAETGATVVVLPADKYGVALKPLWKQLAHWDITSVLIEGGGKLIGSALRAGLVDDMHIYMAPKILGDDDARGSVSGLSIKTMDKAINLKTKSYHFLDEDIFIEATIKKS